MKKRLINALIFTLCICMLSVTVMAATFRLHSNNEANITVERGVSGSTFTLPDDINRIWDNGANNGAGGEITLNPNNSGTFFGWYKDSPGSGEFYGPGAEYGFTGDPTVDFYAAWEPPSSGAPAASGGGLRLYGPYIYKPDEDIMKTPGEAGEFFEYGEAAYYLIVDETGESDSVLTESESVEKLKVRAFWNMGGDIVEGVSIIKKQVDTEAVFEGSEKYHCAKIIGENSADAKPGYYYFVEIKLREKMSVAETDVSGVLEFDRKRDSKKGVERIKECRVDTDFPVFYANTWLDDDIGITVDEQADLEWGTYYALKFEDDDEVELSFGSASGGNNEGAFTFDASGQGKIFFYYTTEPDAAIAAANPEARMDFLTFHGMDGVGIKFNRSGEFVYEMENGAHAYRIADGRLYEIAGCYSPAEEEFAFTTNTLGAYVFADRELTGPA